MSIYIAHNVMAEEMASAKTSKANVFSASAEDDVLVLGYMKDPKSIAGKGHRRLMPLWTVNGTLCCPTADIIRWACPDEPVEKLPEIYRDACKKAPQIDQGELDFTDKHLRNPGDTVLCSNCMQECPQSLRCGPCVRINDFHVFYCSKQCQAAAWPTHRGRCPKS